METGSLRRQHRPCLKAWVSAIQHGALPADSELQQRVAAIFVTVSDVSRHASRNTVWTPILFAGDKSYVLYRECAGAVKFRRETEVDRRRIPDTTPWTKPPYFGRTIALWGLYSAFSVSRSDWTGTANGSITPPCYRRLRCGAIVLTKYNPALVPAAKRLRPRAVLANRTARTGYIARRRRAILGYSCPSGRRPQFAKAVTDGVLPSSAKVLG